MEKFNDWLWEQEGFSLRADRLFADLGSDYKRYEIVVNWLKAAYEIGKQEGDEVIKLLAEVENHEKI
jgi:hypothetical protein